MSLKPKEVSNDWFFVVRQSRKEKDFSRQGLKSIKECKAAETIFFFTSYFLLSFPPSHPQSFSIPFVQPSTCPLHQLP
jgi:hypothetical protein